MSNAFDDICLYALFHCCIKPQNKLVILEINSYIIKAHIFRQAGNELWGMVPYTLPWTCSLTDWLQIQPQLSLRLLRKPAFCPLLSCINDVTVLCGKGSRILWQLYYDLSYKKRDDGGGKSGVKSCPKLRDVINRWPH